MTQEDGFIEVKVNLFNRTPIAKWVRPVYFKKIRLLFNVHCMVIISQDSGLDFSDLEKMTLEEHMAWFIYAGFRSYAFHISKNMQITIEQAERYAKGLLHEDRMAVYQTMEASKHIGKLIESYQNARNADGEDGKSKKKEGSVLKS